MRGTTAKNAGYLLCLVPQILLVLGTHVRLPWLSLLFFFLVLPVGRKFVGDDQSPVQRPPSRWVKLYLVALPRVYCLLWLMVLPWIMWVLRTMPMSASRYLGFALSLWIVCSLHTAIAHEMIHSAQRRDRLLGTLLDASVGYFHFVQEHMVHHARTGHLLSGDVATPGQSIYSFALARYTTSLKNAWRYEKNRLRRKKLPWTSNRLLQGALVTAAIAIAFSLSAGWLGLGVYLFEVIGAAFAVQAITYLQHWGLSQQTTPALAGYGFAWEDGCWMQACVTLNHAFHGQHHLQLRQPYYQLSWSKGGLALPASYPVMLLLALLPPLFTELMSRRLAGWIDQRNRVPAPGIDAGY